MVYFDDGHIGYIDKTGKTVWKSPIQVLKSSGKTTMIRDLFGKEVTWKIISEKAIMKLRSVTVKLKGSR